MRDEQMQASEKSIDYDAELAALIDLMETNIPPELLKLIDESYHSEANVIVRYIITTSEVTDVSRSE